MLALSKDMGERNLLSFQASIDGAEMIYDGDTINGVVVLLHGLKSVPPMTGEMFPYIYAAGEDVYAHIDIRIAGIDAPELHPRYRAPDGSLRSEHEREHERKLAQEARQVVVDLLVGNDLQFEIRNPQIGKYADRLVAEVWVGDVNVGTRVWARGLAYKYEGGRKRRWTISDTPPKGDA